MPCTPQIRRRAGSKSEGACAGRLEVKRVTVWDCSTRRASIPTALVGTRVFCRGFGERRDSCPWECCAKPLFQAWYFMNTAAVHRLTWM